MTREAILKRLEHITDEWRLGMTIERELRAELLELYTEITKDSYQQ